MPIRTVRGVVLFVAAALVTVVLAMTSASSAQVRITVSFAPPALPVYEQPLCPAEGYLWIPGYWAWDDDFDDYYWVPGTWVLAPEVGFLWTPPYWAWSDGVFVFYDGYWGPHVGFYGGIVYGFGYFGEGYVGGRWDGDRFYYNRAVTNVNVTNIRNVYNTTVINNNTTVTRVSYNGGNGGVNARPTPQDEIAMHERHLPPAAPQVQHVQAARGNPELRASQNRGKPPVAATPRPGAFHEAVPARQAGAPYNPPPNRAGARSGQQGQHNAAIHPKDLPPMDRSAAPNTGNAKLDQKYQREQEKLQQRQEQERQKLQQRQDQEHQRNPDAARQQQMEQRHQQETQQMQQRHEQQRQSLEQKQQPPSRNEPRPPKGPS